MWTFPANMELLVPLFQFLLYWCFFITVQFKYKNYWEVWFKIKNLKDIYLLGYLQGTLVIPCSLISFFFFLELGYDAILLFIEKNSIYSEIFVHWFNYWFWNTVLHILLGLHDHCMLIKKSKHFKSCYLSERTEDWLLYACTKNYFVYSKLKSNISQWMDKPGFIQTFFWYV